MANLYFESHFYFCIKKKKKHDNRSIVSYDFHSQYQSLIIKVVITNIMIPANTENCSNIATMLLQFSVFAGK